MFTQIILCKYDLRSVRILESLLRLECISKDITVNDTRLELVHQIVYIGLKEISSILFNQFYTHLVFIIYQIGRLFLICLRTVKISISIDPYRQMPEMILHQLMHVCRLIHLKISDPLVIGRILIENFCSGHLIIKTKILRFLLICHRLIILDEDIVVDTIVSMEDRVKSCHLCTVTDMIRCVTRLSSYFVVSMVGSRADSGK